MITPNGGDILCLGEVLWDVYEERGDEPQKRRLGGAPLNLAFHLNRLNMPARLVSRLGTDRDGILALRELARMGLDADTVQLEYTLPTGLVDVLIDRDGEPTYRIADASAWDCLCASPELIEYARRAQAVVYGSLAQRRDTARRAIRGMWQTPALKVFDANLRPPYVDWSTLEASLVQADLVKVNRLELGVLNRQFGSAGHESDEARARALSRAFQIHLCVTRGCEGAAFLHADHWYEQPGRQVRVVDAVGAGDAFLAGFLEVWLKGGSPDDALAQGNRLGAHVVTCDGATPEHTGLQQML